MIEAVALKSVQLRPTGKRNILTDESVESVAFSGSLETRSEKENIKVSSEIKSNEDKMLRSLMQEMKTRKPLRHVVDTSKPMILGGLRTSLADQENSLVALFKKHASSLVSTSSEKSQSIQKIKTLLTDTQLVHLKEIRKVSNEKMESRRKAGYYSVQEHFSFIQSNGEYRNMLADIRKGLVLEKVLDEEYYVVKKPELPDPELEKPLGWWAYIFG